MRHADAPGIHKGAYTDDSDPGAIGANKLWVDNSVGPPYQLYLRSLDDASWQKVGVVSSGGGGGGGGGGTLANEALVAAGASATASSETTISGGGSGDQFAGNAIDEDDETEWWTAA